MAGLTPSLYEYVFTTATGGKADERLAFKKTPSGGTQTTTNYTYEDGHRIDDAGTENVEHHTDGTRKRSGAGQFEIDALGRVLRVKNQAGTVTKAELEYDPLGRIGSITAQGTQRDLSYFGNGVIQEKIGTTVDRQISRHPMLPGPLAVHDATDTWLTLHDPRHNLLSIADSTGAVAAGDSLRYEPFGTPSSNTTTAGLEPRFGGMRWLRQAGVYLSDTRLMDPRHGAWLSPDPLGYIDSPNLYAYARQNPIDFIDPSGLGTGKGKAGKNSDGGSALDDAWDWLKGAADDALEFGKDAWEWGKGAAEDVARFHLTDDVYDWVAPKAGLVAEFAWGAFKRNQEYVLAYSPLTMFTPVGVYFNYKLSKEHAESGAAGLYVAGVGVEGLLGDESKGEEFGQILDAMGETFSTMSAEEWGSTVFDVAITAPAGGAGVGRTLFSTAGKAAGRTFGRSTGGFLFRGTTLNWARHPVTFTSKNPAVAVTFAASKRRFGDPIVEIVRKNDVADVAEIPSVSSTQKAYEAEVVLDMNPTDFSKRAVHVRLDDARTVLKEMGIETPHTVPSNSRLQDLLPTTRKMTASEAAEFVRRVAR